MSESRVGDDRPRRRGYARLELERRFLLARLPSGLDPDDYERLRDLYVGDTQLRLRRIERPTGELILVKLGQKQPDPEAPGDPRRRSMTTLYLEPGEERALAALQGARGVKRRYSVREQGRTFVVDVHEEPAAVRGLILAEVECDTLEELGSVEVPAWALREVTDDPGYSSALLAAGVVPHG